MWRLADEDLRAAFVKLGCYERAMCGEFVRRVEGRASGLSLQAAPGESEMGHIQGVMQVPLQYGIYRIIQHVRSGSTRAKAS